MTGNDHLEHTPAPLASLYARFDQAELATDYQAVASAADACAETLGGLDAFLARLLSADCRYWAWRVETASPKMQRGVTAADLAEIAEPVLDLVAGAPPEELERFVSLIDVTVRHLLEVTCDDPETNRDWRRLATVVETCVPEDFKFSEARWGTACRLRGLRAAQALARLSLLHGDEPAGRHRLLVSLEDHADSEDVLDHLGECEKSYGVVRDCWHANPMLVFTVLNVQRAILEYADGWRGRYRSRVGRLWVAQLFEPLIGRFQRDMAEPVVPIDPQAHPEAAEPLLALLREQFLRTVEAGKSRLLLDQVTWGSGDPIDAGIEAELIEREEALLAPAVNAAVGESHLRQELQLVSRLPLLFWQDPHQDPEALRATVNQINDVEAFCATHAVGLPQAESVAEIEDLVDELGDRDAIIEYAIPRDTLHPAQCIYIIAITKAGVQRRVVSQLDVLKKFPQLYKGDIGSLSIGGREPIEVSPLGELIFQVRDAIHLDTELAPVWLELLHKLLIDPLEELGIVPADFERWHLVPHGVLHSVPFRALLDPDSGFLNSQVALSVAPSASTWARCRRAWEAPARFVGVADPRPDAGRWPVLTSTEAEVRFAAKSLEPAQCDLFVREDATLEALNRACPGAAVVHIASHGDFPERNVIDYHNMVLTPGQGNDGRLTASRMRHLPLSGTHLAVLSVCDGGLYRVGPGDELYGLIPAALEAGASSVLTTMWAVDDMSTRLWMREFYSQLTTNGPSKAAQQACNKFIENGAAVRDWAGCVLSGGCS